MMLLILALTGLVVWATLYGVDWGVNRWVGPLAALAVNAVITTYFIWNWISLRNFCAAEPTYIAPTPEEAAFGSDGAMLFNCDSAGGAFDYLYIGIIGPLLVIGCLVLTARAFRRYRTAKGAQA